MRVKLVVEGMDSMSSMNSVLPALSTTPLMMSSRGKYAILDGESSNRHFVKSTVSLCRHSQICLVKGNKSDTKETL
jgi:hypothetical protein